MSRSLEALRQAALVQALLQGTQDLPPGLRALPGVVGGVARGLQAYRGNAQAVAEKALAAVFPRLRILLGEADFASLAWTFWRRRPPLQGELGRWAQALPGFLAAQPGLKGEALLPDVARVEWAIHEAEQAPDAVLDECALQALTHQDPSRLALRLRPGLSLLSVVPEAAAQWLPGNEACTAPVALLVWRQVWKAELCSLTPAWDFFMRQLLAGTNLAQSLDLSLEAYPKFEIAAWLPEALSRAWLQTVLTLPEDSP